MKWNILVGSLVLSLGLSTQSFGANLLDRMLGANYNGDRDTATRCDTFVVEPSCGVDVVDGCCVPTARRCRRTPVLDMLRGLRRDDCRDPCGEVVCVEDPCCEPTCGCEDPCGDVACECCCATCRRRPLLDMLRGLRRSVSRDWCCEPTCGVVEPCCEPACGYEDPCAAVCECCPAPKRPGVALLTRIFGARKKAVCCEPTCGVEPCREPTCGYDPSCGFEMSEPTEAREPKAENGEDDEVGPAPVVDPTAFLPTKRRFIQTNLVR